MKYDIQLVGGIKTAIFGGEGLFSPRSPARAGDRPEHDAQRLRRELAPQRKGGDEHSPLRSFGIFGSGD